MGRRGACSGVREMIEHACPDLRIFFCCFIILHGSELVFCIVEHNGLWIMILSYGDNHGHIAWNGYNLFAAYMKYYQQTTLSLPKRAGMLHSYWMSCKSLHSSSFVHGASSVLVQSHSFCASSSSAIRPVNLSRIPTGI